MPPSVYWLATASPPSFPALAGDLKVDLAIIGGGIVGISAARFAKDRGLTVAVVEALRVGQGVSGRATAKVSSQHGVTYTTLAQKFGEDKARVYAIAQEKGLSEIRRLIQLHELDADFEMMPGYVYTQDPDWAEKLEQEAELAKRLGLRASITSQTGLPFDVLTAMRWENQAQFHPLKYVTGLAATIPGNGSHVFENSRVVDWAPHEIHTASGSVYARHVVMATNLPLGQVGMYYATNFPNAEPVVAAPIAQPLGAFYKNAEEPKRSIRTHRHDRKTYLVAVGSAFKPGEPQKERESITELENWLSETFHTGEVEYRWINEDYMPMDGAPFIGWSSKIGDAYLVATGFQGWGFTNGTAAGIIIADLAAGIDNPWLELFDAARIKPVAGAKEFASGNLHTAQHLVAGYASSKPKSYDELAPGEAEILKIDGENVAAYRDENGRIHSVSAACTHMGCLVGWNSNDKTWDCTCHGSRFSLTGEVLHGPAVTPLERK